MTEIIPAILPNDFDDLREHLALVRGIAPMVQIDVTDGDFVPDATWPYINDGDNVFERLANEEEAMPYWQEVDFEIDMMVQQAEESVLKWVNAGARRIVLHVESRTDIEKALREVRDISNDPDSVLYTPVGVALNTTTDRSEVTKWLNERDVYQADFVQCMGIERIGYQGQEFDERVLDHIEALRNDYSDMPITVDGSVNTDTAPQLVEAGATRLVAGSAIFEHDDVSTAIDDLKNVTMEPNEEEL